MCDMRACTRTALAYITLARVNKQLKLQRKVNSSADTVGEPSVVNAYTCMYILFISTLR